MRFFISDTHWGHARIIAYATRPFANVEEMDRCLVQWWNDVVQPADEVFHLGDFGGLTRGAVGRVLRRLHGTVHLIPGNHDKKWMKQGGGEPLVTLSGEPLIIEPPILKVVEEGTTLILCHYPMAEWEGFYAKSWHLHGHVHGNRRTVDPPQPRRVDISVECVAYAPRTWAWIKANALERSRG